MQLKTWELLNNGYQISLCWPEYKNQVASAMLQRLNDLQILVHDLYVNEGHSTVSDQYTQKIY